MNGFELGEKQSELEVFVASLLKHQQPSANELLNETIKTFGGTVKQDLKEAVLNILQAEPKAFDKAYLQHLIDDGSLDQSIANYPDIELKRTIHSEIDSLVQSGIQYRKSSAFQKVINFMAKFKDYSPFNNMLVHLQNPHCHYFATAKHWKTKFNRTLKEDATPMIILAPMHPVVLVYDMDQTEGEPIPEEIEKFAEYSGNWDDAYLARLTENAQKFKIRIDFKSLTSSLAGFATIANPHGEWKMRTVINNRFDNPTAFGTLCHELAHILLGHIDGDKDLWWPSRMNLSKASREIEAEAVAYIVTQRLGLNGRSNEYVSRYLEKDGNLPIGVSLDNIAKVASKLQKMTEKILQEPKVKMKLES